MNIQNKNESDSLVKKGIINNNLNIRKTKMDVKVCRFNLSPKAQRIMPLFDPRKDQLLVLVSDGPKLIGNYGQRNAINLSSYGGWAIIDNTNYYQLQKEIKYLTDTLPFTKEEEIIDFIEKVNVPHSNKPILIIEAGRTNSFKGVLKAKLITENKVRQNPSLIVEEIVLAPTQLRLVCDTHTEAGFGDINIAGKHCFGWAPIKESRGMLKEYGY